MQITEKTEAPRSKADLEDVTDSFRDDNFRAAVREILGIRENGRILRGDCARVIFLDVFGRHIRDLEAKAKGLKALDAPVSGGDIGAKNATLAIMVGGDEDAFDACQDIFKAMGKNIVYEGKAGAGQHVKMANQIVVAANTTGVCEAISYCKAMGIDPETMLKTIETGAAASWQVSNNGPKMCANDFSPGFFIKHFVKDMKIALEECQNKNIQLPVLEKVYSIYQEMEDSKQGELGTQAIISKYSK